ncbi:hypothetical protein M0813_20791 [Anaeramoeba flamelloides]|uniref:Uncharacterized protein n=1 Tax=Anaeramoeba flamelloides TaxID=1746091 RepID=A0AAV7Z231_9EUKA|nr:hypothetical protein M0812_02179 [Anaeramoeba flamelloides]KAJ6244701.1 hypothetical protein M0813_20791 [Anaeramoeba flamelloides]
MSIKEKEQFTNQGYLNFQKNRKKWTHNNDQNKKQTVTKPIELHKQPNEEFEEASFNPLICFEETVDKEAFKKPVKLGSVVRTLSQVWDSFSLFD